MEVPNWKQAKSVTQIQQGNVLRAVLTCSPDAAADDWPTVDIWADGRSIFNSKLEKTGLIWLITLPLSKTWEHLSVYIA